MRLAERRWRKGTVACGVIFLFSPIRALQGGEDLSLSITPRVDISCEVPPDSYRVDQLIPFKIAIRSYDPSADPAYEAPFLPLDNLVIEETTQSVEARAEAGRQIKEIVLRFNLKPLKPGRACVGSFSFVYRTGDSAMPQRAEIEEHCFDIHEKPWVARIPHPVLIAAGGALGILLLGAGVFAIKRRRKQIPEKTASLEERSLKELNAFMAAVSSRDPHDLMSKSSEIFRRYLSDRYETGVAKIGGLELLESIDRRRDIDSDDKKKIRSILESLTECQFGGINPSQEEVLRICQKIKSFIADKNAVHNPPTDLKN